MSIKKIIFFHYHYLRGGISSVTGNLLSALPENIETAAAADPGMGFQGLDGFAINKIPLPGSGYVNPGNFTEKNFKEQYSEIMNIMEKLAGPDTLFWVHNHAIGKNPAFTAAVIEHAKRGLNPVLLHIHDFAECGRQKNYNFLKQHVNKLYPLGKNIRYATINKRDFNILTKSGTHRNGTYYLPNICKQQPQSDKEAARLEVKKQCENSGFAFDMNKPLFVYPVRTIRRKNILEAFLIACISDANIIVTLSANSSPEREYENIVRQCAHMKHFKGCWALGSLYPGHWAAAFSAADLILSTSVMEGFGMLFAEAAAAGKNIIARYLPVLTDFPDLNSQHTYNEFIVPLENRQHKRIISFYKEITNESIEDPVLRRKIMEHLAGKCSGGTCEFSFADPVTQKEIYSCKNIHGRILSLNGDLFKNIENILDCNSLPTSIFSPEKSIPRLNQILADAEKDLPCTYSYADGSYITQAFIRPEYYRILLTRSGGFT